MNLPQGSAVMPSQARALGIRLLYCYQNLTSLINLTSKEESLSIIANCNSKFIGQINDTETLNLLKECLIDIEKYLIINKNQFLFNYKTMFEKIILC